VGKSLVEESCNTNATSSFTQNDVRKFSPCFRIKTSPNPFHAQTRHALWRPLWRWLLPLFEQPNEGFSLDLDSTVGRKLFEMPGYTFRMFVTNRTGEALKLWRDHNKRAVIEQQA
jgi:hypothetical protein